MKEEREIEDIVGNLKQSESRKKGINSGDKGDRGEREICDIFNKHFMRLLSENIKWGRFNRVIGSGAFGHRALSESGKEASIGDILCPTGFRFVLEAKLGYNDANIELFGIADKGNAILDNFLKQVEDDASRSENKMPMLLWRKDRKKHIAFLKTKNLPKRRYKYSLKYRDWTAIPLTELLKEDNDFFFILSD